MSDELQAWWQLLPPGTYATIQTVTLLLLALGAGHVLGEMVARGLRANNFDAALRLPGPGMAPEHGITPTTIAGLLVRLTVWAAAIAWLAKTQGRPEVADTLRPIISRAWALAAILVATLALGSMLAHRLIACLGEPIQTKSDNRPSAATPHWNPAAIAGTAAYFVVLLLALLVASDLFGWPLTRSAALALWQFAQSFFIAAAALFIGCLGSRWARDLASAETTPEKRAGQYTALGIIAATTILAVAVLLASAGVLLAFGALAVLGFLAWMARDYLRDVAAGMQLREHKVREVYFDTNPWQVAQVGFLKTRLQHAGEFCQVQNRLVLDARLQGEFAEVVPR